MNGVVKAGSKTLQCTFTLLYSKLKLDEKKSVAKCKGKVKKMTKIPNYKIGGKELDFTFTLTIPKKGKITFSASMIQPIVVTTTEPTSTVAPSTGKAQNISLVKSLDNFRTRLFNGTHKSLYLSSSRGIHEIGSTLPPTDHN